MLEIARNAAMEILEEDPKLEKTDNRVLATQLRKMKTNTLNWGSIS
jgi:ATP-dependent DNA helicase RecG